MFSATLSWGEPGDLLGRDALRIDRDVGPDFLEQRHVARAVDDGHGTVRSQPFRQHRHEHVLLVGVERRDDDVRLVDVLPGEELRVRRVLLHDERVR